jgi:hypothetical protein
MHNSVYTLQDTHLQATYVKLKRFAALSSFHVTGFIFSIEFICFNRKYIFLVKIIIMLGMVTYIFHEIDGTNDKNV